MAESQMYRFKGLPTKTIADEDTGEEFVVPDKARFGELDLDERVATLEFPTDLGRMVDDTARLVAGTEVHLREIVEEGEIGAGVVGEENYVVEWDLQPYTNNLGERTEGYMRAMSFTRAQFEALFEGVE